MGNQRIEDANYYNDRRVRAGEARRDSPFVSVDTGRKVAVVRLIDDDEESEHEVPIKFEVCETCDGAGTHVNPSVDSNGLTAADFAEDPDFAEDYISGAYDVQCYECGGHRVVPVIDEERLNDEQKELLKKLDKQNEERAASRREREAERRMGA
jgi:hypothetical protein